ncbi:MAG: hypothetical protein RLZZ293_1157 [Pseudomonadota bacterium]|jgi:putative glutamine amidotransferase
MRKPVIGITSNIDSIRALSNQEDDFIFIRYNYINAIVEHGGIPLIINSRIDPNDIEAFIGRLDGILLIGGQDIDPQFYGETCHVEYKHDIYGSGSPYNRPLRDKPNPQRDKFEIELYKIAKRLGLPILGICRGYQLINVAEGGSLYQEIPLREILHTTLANELVPNHEVILQANSLAERVFACNKFITCSIHHQGIKHLGTNLAATGFAHDGLVEIIEGTNPQQFILGMQGHPERSCKEFCEHNNLFHYFVGKCFEYLQGNQLN